MRERTTEEEAEKERERERRRRKKREMGGGTTSRFGSNLHASS